MAQVAPRGTSADYGDPAPSRDTAGGGAASRTGSGWEAGPPETPSPGARGSVVWGRPGAESWRGASG